MRFFACLSLASLVLTASGGVLADEAEAEDETEEEDEPPPTKSGFPAPPPPPAGKGIPTPVHDDKARFRGGVSGFAGPYVAHGGVLGYGGVQGRLGAQIVDLFGIYAAPGIAVLGQGGHGVLGRFSVGVVPELTFADLFFVGVGPELFTVVDGDGRDELWDPFYVAARVRAGFAFGSKRPGRRHAFTLALDTHVDFYPAGAGVAPTLSLGYDAF